MWQLDYNGSWALKNWCFFELWCWRRLFRVPWPARRSKQSILKEISSEYSLEGLMRKLKPQCLATWCKELTYLKRPWCWERLKAGGEGDNRGWDGWMALPSQWTWVWASSGSWWWTGKPSVLRFMVSQRVGHDWVTELNWTDLNIDVQRGCLKFQKYCHPFPGPPPIVWSLIRILGLFKR